MQKNLVTQPKHQSKPNNVYGPNIPGVGQSKQQPNPKRSLSQFLQFLNNDDDQPNTQTTSPHFQSSCTPIVPPLKQSQIHFSSSNSPKAKKQLSLSTSVLC